MNPIPNHIMLGKVIGVHGVRGAVKLYSECRPREQIFFYKQYLLRNEHNNDTFKVTLKSGRTQGKGLVAEFAGYDNRDRSYSLIGHSIWVHHQQLPPLPPNEFYWHELIGLQVVNLSQVHLGEVGSLIETGANDVMIVKTSTDDILIPFIFDHYIINVDKQTGTITVDWEEDWSTSTEND